MLCLSRVSGVIFAGGGLEEPHYRHAMTGYARSIAGYGGAIVALQPRAERWPSEVPDNRTGARLATDHLVALGHVRVAMISGPATLRTSRERELGYADAMHKAGFTPNIVEADFTTAGGAQAMTCLLGDRSVTAVFVATDRMALGALAELRRQGIRVPDDISVVGFDDIPGLEFIHPNLTTVRVPLQDLGAAGVARLLQELDGPSDGARVRLHPVELVRRESTGLRRAAVGGR